MFIGHFGVAFAAKKLAPQTSLGTLFAAAEALDLLWPILVLGNVEHVKIAPGSTKLTPLDFYDYPISHSLTAVCVWSLIFAFAYFTVRRYRRGAWVIGALVASHWFLDALVHRADLPLAPWRSNMIGLGLWNHVGVAVTLEFLIFIAGLLLYLSTTKAKDRAGSFALWLLTAFLLALWAGNLFGPPPPNVRAIGIVGVAGGVLFLVWGAWIDAHRTLRNPKAEHVRLFTEKHAAI